MALNTKQRNEEIARATRAFLLAQNASLNEFQPLRQWRDALAAQVGCHPDTAERHLVQQLRLMRGEMSKAEGGWGGEREGSGRPQGRIALRLSAHDAVNAKDYLRQAGLDISLEALAQWTLTENIQATIQQYKVAQGANNADQC